MKTKKTLLLKPVPVEARIVEFKKIALNTELPPEARGYALNSLSKMGKKALEPLLDFIVRTEKDDDMQEFAAQLVDRMRQRGSASRER